MTDMTTPSNPEWYKDAFDETYIALFEPLRPPEFTNREVSCFIDHLQLEEGSRILDLGCGYGRHSIALAQQGYDVVGVDLSETLLAKARADSAVSEVSVDWIQADMRNIHFTEEFDAVINNAFGYLESDAEDEKVVEQVFQALKPGGRFLQWEILNREHWVRNFQQFNIARHGDSFLIRENSFDPLTSREHQTFTIASPDTSFTKREISVRIYTLTELVKIHSRAGLEHVKHSALDGSPLTFETNEVLIVSRKPT